MPADDPLAYYYQQRQQRGLQRPQPEAFTLTSLMPNPLEAFFIGAMMVPQTDALRSGGLVGYRTLFIGTGDQASWVRRYNLWSYGLRALEWGSRQLLTRYGSALNNTRYKLVLESLQDVSREGLAGARRRYLLMQMSIPGLPKMPAIQLDADYFGLPMELELDFSKWKVRFLNKFDQYDFYGYPHLAKRFSKQEEILSQWLAEYREQLLKQAERLREDKLLKLLGGVFGGLEDPVGAIGLEGKVTKVSVPYHQLREGADVAKAAVGNVEFVHQAPREVQGFTMLRGRMGSLIGGAIKAVGWLTLLEVGLRLGSAALVSGASYLSRIHTQMEQRYLPRPMDPVYLSQAAQTERQRVMAFLQDRQLNPTAQLMGNEAYFYHR